MLRMFFLSVSINRIYSISVCVSSVFFVQVFFAHFSFSLFLRDK